MSGLSFGTASYGAVTDLVGRYEGAWTNQTFGSTGKAVIDIQLAGTNAAIAFAMEGYVFGYTNQPLITMPGTVSGNGIRINNQGVGIFGDIAGAIDATAGTFSATLTNIPGGFIQAVTANGTIQSGVIQLGYVVQFPGPTSATNPARGIMGVRLDPTLRILRQVDGVLLQWAGGPNTYQVQTRPSLTSGTWVNQGQATTNASVKIPFDTSSMKFFRLLATP